MDPRPLIDCKPGNRDAVVDGVRIDDSAHTFLRLMSVCWDERLTEHEKPLAMSYVISPEWCDEHPGEVMSDVLWDAFGIDVTGTRIVASDSVCFDWRHDADRIRASLLMAYGINWDDVAASTSFRDVCGWLNGLMESGDTPFQQAVFYRTASLPSGASSEQRAAWDACVEHYAIDGSSDPYGDDILREML